MNRRKFFGLFAGLPFIGTKPVKDSMNLEQALATQMIQAKITLQDRKRHVEIPKDC